MGLLWRQFFALFRKNWLVLFKHPIINIFRCIVFPIALGAILAKSPTFFRNRQTDGLGTVVPISPLNDAFTGLRSLVWVDVTNKTSALTSENIMAHVTTGFNSAQLKAVKRVDTVKQLLDTCAPKKCFAGITFNNFPESTRDKIRPVNYTISAEQGDFFIDVKNHHTWTEETLLPLQMAIEHAAIELTTGVKMPVPEEWPFTSLSKIDYERENRLGLLQLMRSLLVFIFLISYIGIASHLPGAVAYERANHLTSHMKAMGLSDWARTLSWYFSFTMAYLPGWIAVALVWAYLVFVESNHGLILAVHLLLGFSLASWSLFVAVPFGRSPYLASIVTSMFGIGLVIIASNEINKTTTGPAAVLSLFFPPMFYVFAMRAICGYELAGMATNILHPDPADRMVLLPLICIALINVFLWPYLAVLLDRALYDVRRDKQTHATTIPENAIISIRNLQKTYKAFRFRRFKMERVNAIVDLTMDIPKGGVFALLGPNGAGKSTTLDILGGLTGHTGGSVTFEGDAARPPHGTIGIVPQKNVLFSELSCLETLQVWKEIKRSVNSSADEDLEQLLRDCDLAAQIHSTSGTLSGGQKRKLQLAIGLVGGSKIVLVDECTSGVDPISRRALWKTLTSHREERTIILTTHFLDEADLLADGVVVLGSQGKLIAEGSPVALKSNLGEGYTVQVTFKPESTEQNAFDLFRAIAPIAPDTYVTVSSPFKTSYHLKTRDLIAVENVLRTIDTKRHNLNVESFDVLGTSIEDIFLNLMDEEKSPDFEEKDEKKESHPHITPLSAPFALPDGRPRSPWAQALTIFHKRIMVVRRSWISPLLAVLVVILLSYFPLKFLVGEMAGCARRADDSLIRPQPFYLPLAENYPVLITPPNVASILNVTTARSRDDDLTDLYQNLPDRGAFINQIKSNYTNIGLGGISLNLETRDMLIAWAAYSFLGPANFLNLGNNIIYNHALNTTETPSLIHGYFLYLPSVQPGALIGLQWVLIFGVAMAVFSAFSALYVARERQSSVQAMQSSNGLSDPIGLWLGHLLFDSIPSLIVSIIIVALFASMSQFLGLGLLGLVIFLYCISGALLSYAFTIVTGTPLAAFAAALFYQVVMLILTLLPYILASTQADPDRTPFILTVCHFTISLLAPISSLARASIVSINLFKLDCDGEMLVAESALVTIKRYGGPILYLILQPFALLALLVWADSGSSEPWKKLFRRGSPQVVVDATAEQVHDDVATEAKQAFLSLDLLRVLDVSKSFGGKRVVEDVSFGVSRNTIFAMLGPNGAGKTTTLGVIRGSLVPDAGDVIVNGASMMRHRSAARLSLGVCPQFSTIDAQLTAREHLMIYGRLKGLYRGEELNGSVNMLLQATGLGVYADRLANKLSGGNQRKLSLAIALIGNPPVILIDEFSTGVDAAVKRDLWKLIKEVAPGKAFVITTHSMEEASALATKVGILSKQMLAVGSPADLAGRYSTYTVHFSCRTPADRQKAQKLMAQIPESKMALDLSTRFEVPIVPTREGGALPGDEEVLSLANLFHLLAQQTDFPEFTVEKSTLEAAFIKIIREKDARDTAAAEVGAAGAQTRARRWLW